VLSVFAAVIFAQLFIRARHEGYMSKKRPLYRTATVQKKQRKFFLLMLLLFSVMFLFYSSLFFSFY